MLGCHACTAPLNGELYGIAGAQLVQCCDSQVAYAGLWQGSQAEHSIRLSTFAIPPLTFKAFVATLTVFVVLTFFTLARPCSV